MTDSVEKNGNDDSESAELQKLEDYKQDVASQVPFGGVKVATESDHSHERRTYKSKGD